MAADLAITNDLHVALLEHVRSKQRGNITLTYTELIAKTGRKLNQQGIGPHLTAIGNQCEANGQPRLDYLVVNKTTRVPGFEVSYQDWIKEIERCRSFQWPVDL